MNMKKIILILFVLIFTACAREVQVPESTCISTSVLLSVVDSDGTDLLNPNASLPNSIDIDAIKIYDVMANGEEVYRYNELLDYPKGFSLWGPHPKIDESSDYFATDKYVIHLGLSFTGLSDFPVRIRAFNSRSGSITKWTIKITETIIEWDEGNRNVIRAEKIEAGQVIFLGKIWVDGKLVLDLVDSEKDRRNPIITLKR